MIARQIAAVLLLAVSVIVSETARPSLKAESERQEASDADVATSGQHSSQGTQRQQHKTVATRHTKARADLSGKAGHGPFQDRLGKLDQELDEHVDLINENLDNEDDVLDSIDNVYEKTDKVHEMSHKFEHAADDFKDRLWNQHAKMATVLNNHFKFGKSMGRDKAETVKQMGMRDLLDDLPSNDLIDDEIDEADKAAILRNGVVAKNRDRSLGNDLEAQLREDEIEYDDDRDFEDGEDEEEYEDFEDDDADQEAYGAKKNTSNQGKQNGDYDDAEDEFDEEEERASPSKGKKRK